MKKILEGKRKIRFQDCDPFKHLNNSKYIDYFVNVREDELIDNYNFDYLNIAQTEGVGWVTGSNQITYLKPANLSEIVIIQSQIIKLTPLSTMVEFRMYNVDKTELKSVMWSNFIHINMETMRSTKHSQKFVNLFESIILPINESTFEERIKALIREQKKR
jgi:acyl-CoA thioester hydrolase